MILYRYIKEVGDEDIVSMMEKEIVKNWAELPERLYEEYGPEEFVDDDAVREAIWEQYGDDIIEETIKKQEEDEAKGDYSMLD